MWAFLQLRQAGASLVVVCGFLIVVASPVAEHRLKVARASVVAVPEPWSTGSTVMAHGLSCSVACGIFLDQGSNLRFLHLLQGSPYSRVFEQHFPFFDGKDQTSFRTEHSHLEEGRQTISGAHTSPLQFLHEEIITPRHVVYCHPNPLASRGGRNKSKHIPDAAGKMGFGKRMFVQNQPKIEKQEEEEATS